jgi:hypothetical protein
MTTTTQPIADHLPELDHTPAPPTVWPPDYTSIFLRRQEKFLLIKDDELLQAGSKEYYKTNPVAFINDWCITYDPRNVSKGLPTVMPFCLFPRQEDLVLFLLDCMMDLESGLIEKCRDMGATWVCAAFSTWLWIFHHGSATGWGSRKEQLVDKIGDPDSIFEKIRMIIQYLPFWFLPESFKIDRHCSYMKILNPEGSATITGEAGDNIGRGGRKSMYFKDESAHYERPDKIEAALGDNTDVQIDISSVNGNGNIFHRRRLAGQIYDPKNKPGRGVTRIFIMDWRDHPTKDQAWYDARRAKAESEGLLHIFNQEVDRDYSSAVEGILIPGRWVKAAIDAHIVLGFDDEGKHRAGFDPYDEGMDSHALVAVKGSIFTYAEMWSEGDTGQAANKAVEICKDLNCGHLQYDSPGVGAGVKAETNRLRRKKKLPQNLRVLPWNGGGKVMDPSQRVSEMEDDAMMITKDQRDRSADFLKVNEDEIASPKNKDFFKNIKSQGGWNLRRRFERTYKAVHQGVKYDPAYLISIPSGLPYRTELENELSQPTYKKDPGGKILINKKPEGTKSPNLFDSTVMATWEVKVFDPSEFVIMGGPSGSKEMRVA